MTPSYSWKYTEKKPWKLETGEKIGRTQTDMFEVPSWTPGM